LDAVEVRVVMPIMGVELAKPFLTVLNIFIAFLIPELKNPKVWDWASITGLEWTL
jgi:hypothetical protein